MRPALCRATPGELTRQEISGASGHSPEAFLAAGPCSWLPGLKGRKVGTSTAGNTLLTLPAQLATGPTVPPRSLPARPGWLRGRVPTGVSGQHPASPPSRNRLSLAAEKGPKSVGPGPLPTSSRLPLCMRVRTQRHVPWFTRQKCLCDLL